MIQLLVYFLAAFGLAYVLGHSTISLPARVWLGGDVDRKPAARFGPFLVRLLECPACLGFWIGAAWALGPVPGFEQTGETVALFACATSGVNLILGKATGLI